MRTSTIQVIDVAPSYARRGTMSRTSPKPEDAPELANLKKYLRWRVRRWTAETPMGQEPRQQRDFARLSGLSAGTVSNIVGGGPFSETAVTGILRVLKLSWPEAFDEAERWRAGGSGRDTGPGANLRQAIEQFEERPGGKPVGEKALSMLVLTERREGATWTVKQWLSEIPGIVTAAELFPNRVEEAIAQGGDVAGHALSRATKPRQMPPKGRKTDRDAER